MSNPMSMIWHRQRSDRWVSADGRYTATKARGIADRMVVCVYWYGYLVLRQHHDVVGDDLPNSIRRWCEEHRQRALSQVLEFEAWASQHYSVDIAAVPGGPLMRRDRVRQLIERRGDGRLGLPWRRGPTMTINQRFAQVYQSIEPESAMCAKDPA